MPTDFLTLLDDRVLILDGAMGSNLQQHPLSLDDWGGKELENCSEWLNLTRPDVIEAIHRSFLEVGCDAVETNTFGGVRHVLAVTNHATPHDRGRFPPCQKLFVSLRNLATAAISSC